MSITAPNRTWFRISYTKSAPRGLPRVFLADQVIRYSDDSGTWYAALWRDVGARGHVSSCILRVAATHVSHVSEHADGASAAATLCVDSRPSDGKGGDTK